MQHAVVRLAALLGAVALTACASSSGPSLSFPIAGTYTGSITYQMLGNPAYTAPFVPGITIQLNDPDVNGTIAGTFAFNQGFTATGNIVAQVGADASTISWDQFGDSAQPLFHVAMFFAVHYPTCNFSDASFALGPTGGFDGNGNLDLAGTYTAVHCAVDLAGDSDTTSMNVSLAAFNPAPDDQRPTHIVSLHSVLGTGLPRSRE